MADSKEVYYGNLENERAKYVTNKYCFSLLFLIFFCTHADLLNIYKAGQIPQWPIICKPLLLVIKRELLHTISVQYQAEN